MRWNGLCGPLHPDLHALYARFDGVLTPETVAQSKGFFFGHFVSDPADLLVVSNRVSRTRTAFPLKDEVVVSVNSTLRKELLFTPLPTPGDYVLTTALSAISHVRFIAFDSIPAMVFTYRDALKTGAWRFDAHSEPMFDMEAFRKIVKRHNAKATYWDLLADGNADFKLAEYETGRLRPETDAVCGYTRLASRLGTATAGAGK